MSAEQSAVRDAEGEDPGPALRRPRNTVHGHEDSGAELVRGGQRASDRVHPVLADGRPALRGQGPPDLLPQDMEHQVSARPISLIYRYSIAQVLWSYEYLSF